MEKCKNCGNCQHGDRHADGQKEELPVPVELSGAFPIAAGPRSGPCAGAAKGSPKSA